MRVWIAQCLCPQRHAIMATAKEVPDAAAGKALVPELRAAVEEALRSRMVNPWCGICKADSTRWSYEAAPTRYRTMPEAEPALKEAERQQRIVAALFGEG